MECGLLCTILPLFKAFSVKFREDPTSNTVHTWPLLALGTLTPVSSKPPTSLAPRCCLHNMWFCLISYHKVREWNFPCLSFHSTLLVVCPFKLVGLHILPSLQGISSSRVLPCSIVTRELISYQRSFNAFSHPQLHMGLSHIWICRLTFTICERDMRWLLMPPFLSPSGLPANCALSNSSSFTGFGFIGRWGILSLILILVVMFQYHSLLSMLHHGGVIVL